MKRWDAFEIPFKVVGKERPRRGRNGTFYTPNRTKTSESDVLKCYLEKCEPRPTYAGSVHLFITIYMPPAQRVPKWERTQMIDQAVPCLVKPDIDNIVKTIMDALNGHAYKDDAQVDSLTVRKVWGEDHSASVDLMYESIDHEIGDTLHVVL